MSKAVTEFEGDKQNAKMHLFGGYLCVLWLVGQWLESMAETPRSWVPFQGFHILVSKSVHKCKRKSQMLDL